MRSFWVGVPVQDLTLDGGSAWLMLTRLGGHARCSVSYAALVVGLCVFSPFRANTENKAMKGWVISCHRYPWCQFYTMNRKGGSDLHNRRGREPSAPL
mmetsp:Transcript_10150/g.25730  ORF Transcript_10150/g.25730 Transcript_10150/m.25730 type:complete len:98 (+) Transcript_10150:1263-1556(+)